MDTKPQRGSGGKGSGGGALKWVLGVVALVIAAVVLIQLFKEEESAGPEAGVTISDITDNPEEFYGQDVTVSGEVAELIGERGFSIGVQDDATGGTLLVLGAQELPQILEGDAEEIAAEDVVQTTGTVREFNLAEVEEDIGADLDDGLFAEYEGDPVLVADTVDVTPEASDAGEQNVQATLADVTDEPEEYYGQDLTLNGVVGATIEPGAFVMVDGETASEAAPEDLAGEGVLVVSAPDAAPSLTEGQDAQASGRFREFDLAAFEEELGVDLDDGLYADWDGRPALMADQIQQGQ